MKFALIGQDIPALLPSLLTDLFFAGHAEAEAAMEESNPAMADVLSRYARAVLARAGVGGTFSVSAEREEVLRGADCVIYAGDYLAASRFRQDREALLGPDGDPGLSDQARVDAGLGGLMHTLRQGEKVYALCDAMESLCPGALAVTLGRPVARTAAMFTRRGFRCFGLGPTPLRGPGGVEGIAARLGKKLSEVRADVAGLPGFAFLLGLRDSRGRDLMPDALRLGEQGELGRLPKRWLAQWGALAVGDTRSHAEHLPAQEDFAPEENPAFGESVERRKERILYMNTVGEKGLADREAMMAQMLLLSRAPAQRPVQLALALLEGGSVKQEAVSRVNNGEIVNLPREAIVESRLRAEDGSIRPDGWRLPQEAAELCLDIDETSRLAARAAEGDRSALRECVELDPALTGLDRLYVQDVAEALLASHSDILTRFEEDA